MPLGVVYLPAVVLISTSWGLGLLTAVMSAAAFNWFHIAPKGRFDVADRQNWVALGVLLAVAVTASSVASFARSRKSSDNERRLL